ncbi:MAG TPA: hypothetical protein VHL98_15410 [Microvirga sp.]|nr:hypothetical protein [Microvirga sp.]
MTVGTGPERPGADADRPVARCATPLRAARAPAELERALADTVTAIEDLERRCERERAAIADALHPQVWKDWKLAQLERWRQDRRAPLVQHMATLHQRLVSARLLRESAQDVIRTGAITTTEGQEPHAGLA